MEFKEFKIGDLFQVKSSKKIFHANQVEILSTKKDGCYPYVVRSAVNNGIRGFIKTDKINVNKGNSLSFAQDTFVVFYQKEDYVTGNNIKILEPLNNNFNEYVALYIVSIINKAIAKFSWGCSSDINKVKSLIINLPTTDEINPDWEYMETKIKRMEFQKIRSIDAYLKEAGLNDFELKEDDKQILSKTRNNAHLKEKQFKIGDLFKSQNGDTDIKKEHINNKGIAVITSGVENCGVLGLSDIPAKIIKKNSITIDMFGHSFYRDYDYKIVTHARVFTLELISQEMTNGVGLYLSTQFTCLSKIFNYSNMCSFAKIRNMLISLPIKTDEQGNPIIDADCKYHKDGYIPDWEYMETKVKRMEFQKIRSIDACLKEAGLNDFELKEDDKQILSKTQNNAHLKEKQFKIIDFFSIITTKSIDRNKIEFKENGFYDFVGRTSINFGVQGKIDALSFAPNPKNTFSLVQVGETVALWREKEWYASQNIFLLNPKIDKITASFLYFQVAINQQLKIYGKDYNNYPTIKSLQSLLISLPIKTDEQGNPIIDADCKYHENGYIPDWEYMAKYINVMKKLVIVDVNEYLNTMLSINHNI